MEYTLRILKAKDLFLVSKIIDKIGFKEFKGCLRSDNVLKLMNKDSKNVEAIGMEVFFDLASIVISNFDKVENDLYALISNLSNIDVKDIKELDLSDFTQIIVDILSEPKNRDFIKVASKLFK